MTSFKNIDPNVSEIISKLNSHGEEAYLVGGAVRDLLLNTVPKDYDLSTSATPEKIKKIFGGRARIIGRRFRLVHIQFDKEVYEISTFRRKPDENERRGRKDDEGLMIWRDNEYGTLEDDAFRRDFTVNALYYNPINGELIDLVGGQDDIKNKKVRAIGNAAERMLEDPVRMLRATKLMAQYDFEMNDDLHQATMNHSEKIALCSQARLFEEIIKILKKPYSVGTFSELYRYGLLDHLIPHLAESWESEQGDLCRKMLAVRDHRMLTHSFYSDSRVLAFGTLAFSFVHEDLCRHLGSEDDFWAHGSGVDRFCKSALFRFFNNVSIPKFVRLRLHNLILGLPRFLKTKKKKALFHNREYRYAREVMSIIVEVFELAPDTPSEWPAKSPFKPVDQKESGPRRRHFPRRKKH